MTTRRSPTDVPILDVLAQRYSPLAFSSRPLDDGQVHTLLEAARWAPSSFNDQPWRLILATSSAPEAHGKMAAVIVEGNRVWACRAPLLLLAVAAREFSTTGTPNPHGAYDLAAAITTMTIQATAMGLGVRQMAGFDGDLARAVYKIPADFEPIVAIAVGYPDDPDALPASLAARARAPRHRRPLSSCVFVDTFGTPWTPPLGPTEGE